MLCVSADLYSSGVVGQLGVTRTAPRYEGRDIRGWVSALPSLAASVRIPVHCTLGDHERVWDPSPEAVSSFASLFTASPRVVPALQPDAAHNLSRCWTAATYHQSVMAFASQCQLVSEQTITNPSPRSLTWETRR